MIKIVIGLLSLFLLQLSGRAQKTVFPLPTPEQVRWHEAELGVIFHYDLHVFDQVRYSQAANRIIPIADYNIFNPQQLNTDQWVLVGKECRGEICCIDCNS